MQDGLPALETALDRGCAARELSSAETGSSIFCLLKGLALIGFVELSEAFFSQGSVRGMGTRDCACYRRSELCAERCFRYLFALSNEQSNSDFY